MTLAELRRATPIEKVLAVIEAEGVAPKCVSVKRSFFDALLREMAGKTLYVPPPIGPWTGYREPLPDPMASNHIVIHTRFGAVEISPRAT